MHVPVSAPRLRRLAALAALLLNSCGAAAGHEAASTPPAAPAPAALSHPAVVPGSRLEVLGAGLDLVREVWIGDEPQARWSVPEPGRLVLERAAYEAGPGVRPLRLRDDLGAWHDLPLLCLDLALDPGVFAHGSRPRAGVLGLAAPPPPAKVRAWLGAEALPVAVEAGPGPALRLGLGPLADGTPTGWTPLALWLGEIAVAPFPVPVVRLLIEEVDSDTPGVDAAEFVEVSCGLTSLDLDGYVLVFFNGGHPADGAYFALDLGATTPPDVTSPDGLLVAGNAGVLPPPRAGHRWPDNRLQNGADAVALYQGRAAGFPAGTPPTRAGLIDALVYGTSDPPDLSLLTALLGTGPEAVQADEDGAGRKDEHALARVSRARLDGRAFQPLPAGPWRAGAP